ncbi:MAG: prolyl oligopeptidase family serine peptidase [Halobacteriales archaeon]
MPSVIHDIRQYLAIHSTTGPSFNPDGDRLAFLSDATGTPQVWTVDAPGQAPEQRTYFDERVSFVAYSPERAEFIFGMDEGSNERDQFFQYDVSEGTVTPLTEIPEAKHQWGGWDPTGERFAFASNRRETGAFDVYVQDRDAVGDAAERVYEHDGYLSVVGGFDPAGERLVLREEHASSDQDLYVLDIASGERQHVTPHDGDARYDNINWGPEGEALYLTTDETTDTMTVVRLDLDSLTIEPVIDSGDWNVALFEFDADSETVVYERNVDGYSELSAGKLTGPLSVEVQSDPDFSDGMVEEITIGPDGDQFAVTFSNRNQNHSIHVVDVATGDEERWTRPSLAGIPPTDFQAPDLIRYRTFDDRDIPAFFTLPDRGEPPYPAIVDIHGGPTHQRRPWFNPVKQFFLDSGYALLETNVRGSSGYGKEYIHLDDVERRMDSVKDIKAGVEWLQDQDSIDADRIVAYGRSYGGFMVLASVTEYPELWAAGIDFVGIANWVTFLENTGEWRRDHRAAEYGNLSEHREFLEEISPINNIDRIQAPLMVLHGENDPRVPVGEARQVAEQAAEHVPVETLIFEDEGHHFTKRENQVETFQRIAAFLDEYV